LKLQDLKTKRLQLDVASERKVKPYWQKQFCDRIFAVQRTWTSHGHIHLRFDASLANKRVPCAWLSSGALEVWRVKLRYTDNMVLITLVS